MDSDPTDIAGEEQRRNERAEREKRFAALTRQNIEWIMSTREGRRFMWGLLERSRVFQLSYAGPGADATTNFREGGRNVGLYYLTLIGEHCEAEYSLMIKEKKEDDKQH